MVVVSRPVRKSVIVAYGGRSLTRPFIHTTFCVYYEMSRSVALGTTICSFVRATSRLACVLIWLAAVSFSNAMAAAPPLDVGEACRAEIRSLCLRPWRLTPDAISRCVEDNRLELSSTCRVFWDATHMCLLELEEVCGGLNPLMIGRCLRNSTGKISQACQEMLNDR